MAKQAQRRELTDIETRDMWKAYYASLAGDEDVFEGEQMRSTFTHSWENSVRVVLERARIRDGHRLLDAGCGWGRILIGVTRERKNLTVDAVDMSASALEIGKKMLGTKDPNNNTINWMEGNIERLTFRDDTYDAAYSARVFQHLNDPGKGIAEVLRVLKPGGFFAIFLQNKWNPFNVTYYSNLFSPADCRGWFDKSSLPSELHVASMDFFPNFMGSLPTGLRLGIERTCESIPGINQVGGKVLLWGRK